MPGITEKKKLNFILKFIVGEGDGTKFFSVFGGRGGRHLKIAPGPCLL
jgi:hypothetical protein